MYQVLLPYIQKIITNKYVIIGVTVVTLAVGAYLYHVVTQRKIENLEHENHNLRQTVAVQKEKLFKQDADYKTVIDKLKKYNKEVESLKVQNKELEDKLYREREGKKSLEELARKKSQLVEKAVNRGTKKVLDCFENITNNKECE
jgi:chromosome segregation ATPase